MDMDTLVIKTTNLNVFERVYGIVWRWVYNAQAKRRAKRESQRIEAYMAKRRTL